MSRSREECIADAGAAYGALLADLVRGPEIRAARAAAQAASETAAGRASGGVTAGSPNPTNTPEPHQQSA